MRYGVACLCLGLFVPLPSLSAQSREVLLAEGDALPGGDGLREVRELEVNDPKVWLAEILTRRLDPFDQALFSGGPIQVREGMRLEEPSGSTLLALDSIDLNDRGDIALAMRIRLPDSSVAEAVFWNQKPILEEFDPIGSPSVPAGSVYETFDFVKLNDRNTLLVVGDLRTPTRRDMMVKLRLDELGNVLNTTVFTVPHPIPGMPGAVLVAVASSETSFAMNNHGDVISYAATTLGNAVLLDMDVPLAREGQSSPVGRLWSSLAATRVALNDAGDHVLTGTLDGSSNRYLIEKNGAKFAQEGDVLPALSALPLLGGSTAPIHLANTGDVFWHARVEGGQDDAFMRNHEPIVKLGMLVEGRKVALLDVSPDAFTISPDGRFFVCNVELGDGADAALFLDFGLALELPGCAGNPGELALSSGQVRAGQTFELAMDDGHVAGALARIDFALKQRVPGSDCGVLTPAGEVLISLPHVVASLFPAPWDGTNPTSVVIAVPNDLLLVDKVLFAQGTFRTPGTAVRSLTNALRIEIGAP